MSKKDMILTLRSMKTTWRGVYELFSPTGKGVEGWYVAFDGPSLNDMYLTNEHPMGYKSGDIINKRDFDGVEQVKPVVVGYRRIEIRGVEITPFMTHTREQAITKAKRELSLTGIKSKFRPVYKKEAS